MQTRSTRLSSNPAFFEQYDRRRLRDAQNAKKRAAADTPTNTDQSRLTRAEAAAARQLQREYGSGSRQQQRGQRTEQKEDNVIVLDDEESSDEEDNVPLQQKRRRLNSINQPATSTVDTAAPRPSSNARVTDSHSAAVSPRLPPRRALLSGLPAYISTLVSSSLNYISSPFTSKVTHYTRQRNKHAARSTRVHINPSITHTLSDGRWQHTADGREEAAHPDEDDRAIDRTFRVISDSDFQDSTPYLTYPPNNPRYSITLTYGDLHRLNPNEFLNDTLIEFYLLYIRDRVVPVGLRGRFHFFNSFLFTRLSEFGVGGVRAVYDHVKGWTKGVNLFEKDWIVMPINDADRHHWSLVIIAHPGRAMRPNGTLGIDAALTADRAKQRQQQQQAGSGARQAGSRLPGRSAGGGAGAQQRTKAATPSPAKTSLRSNPRQPRNGTVQQSIPDLFASQGSTPSSSLLALSSPPLTVPKQQPTKPPRSLRQRSHGEQLAMLAQQQQQPSSGKRATRQSSHDPLMSPENETTRRLTESKGNIRAAMNGSPYSKRSRPADSQQRRQEEQWQRALAVPDEQPIIADTQPLEMDEEKAEEKSAPSPAVTSAASSADSVLPTQLYDDEGVEGPATDVGEVDEDDVPLIKRASSNEKSRAKHEEADQQADMDHQGGQSAQQAADGNDDDPNIEIEADEPDADIPILPRITDSVPPTLPLPSQPTSSSSPSSKPSKAQPSTSEPIEAGWRPCILHFDSLRIPPYQTKRIANILREYLQCEWEHQQQLHHTPPPPQPPPPPPPPNTSLPHYSVPLAATRHFTDKTFPHYDVDVPQQPNDYDCGVYILHFAELFCAEPWQDVRRLDREGWLTSRMERGGDKRVAMRELVDQLHSEEEFEKVRLLSVQEMKREVEQKQRDSQQKQQQQQQAPHKQKVEWHGSSEELHKDVYVPDSDEEGSEQRKGNDGRVENGTRRRVGRRLSSSGQRALGGDDTEGESGGLSTPVNRSISFVVPSSQPAEDEDYEPQ